MLFKDYYSILGISHTDDKNVILNAYNLSIGTLGNESRNVNHLNYKQRLEVEVAYRILASFILKTAYDEEYVKAMSGDVNGYEIKDQWLITKIRQEYDYVTKNVSIGTLNGNIIPSDKKSWIGKTLGCVGKIIVAYLCLASIVAIKKCARESISNNNNRIESVDNAECRLNRIAMDENANLPKALSADVTLLRIEIESNALVYVYEIDDDYFLYFQSHAYDREEHLANLRQVRNQMRPMIELLIETGRGITYRYICKNAQSIHNCTLSYSDLINL